MPQIREYNQQTSAPGPVQRQAYSAEQFGALEGQATAQLGQAVQGAADVVAKRMDQANTSDVTAKITKANADLAVDLQETIRTAEPGDNKPFEAYNKRVEDTLGKIGEEANTVTARAFFGEASARIKGQLSQTAASGQAELAGIKAVTDYETVKNSLSAAALADPSSIGLQRDLHKQAIENLVATGGLPRHQATKLLQDGETALAKSTIMGWAEVDPAHAKKKLKDGDFDKELGAEGKIQMLGYIKTAEAAKLADEERRIRLNERAIKVAQTQTQNNFLEKLQKGELTAQQILKSNLDPIGSGSKEQFIGMLNTANREQLKDDPSVVLSLFNRIHLPDGDPNKLVDENELNNYFGRRGLGFSGLAQLRQEMQGAETEAGKIERDLKKQVMNIARGKLTKSNAFGLRDPEGDAQMLSFMQSFNEEYRARRQQGESAQSILSPASPNYIGKNIDAFVRTPQDIVRDMAPKRSTAPQNTLSGTLFQPLPASGGPPPARYVAPPPAPKASRQPGESPEAFLKRIKGQ